MRPRASQLYVECCEFRGERRRNGNGMKFTGSLRNSPGEPANP